MSNKKDEALLRALGVLAEAANYTSSESWSPSMTRDCERVINHIKEALAEQPAQQEPEMQPCAGRNCGSTNPNLHSAECFEDYEKATGLNQWQETDAPHWNSYKQGWEDGVVQERQRIVNLLMIQHEMANGAHNYWHVAAQLIQADVASDT